MTKTYSKTTVYKQTRLELTYQKDTFLSKASPKKAIQLRYWSTQNHSRITNKQIANPSKMYPKVVISSGVTFISNHPRAAIKQRIALTKDILKTIMHRGEVKMVD